MIDITIVAVLVVVLGAAAAYIIKAKKSGKKCIGCPDGGACGGACSSCAQDCSANKSE